MFRLFPVEEVRNEGQQFVRKRPALFRKPVLSRKEIVPVHDRIECEDDRYDDDRQDAFHYERKTPLLFIAYDDRPERQGEQDSHLDAPEDEERLHTQGEESQSENQICRPRKPFAQRHSPADPTLGGRFRKGIE